MEHLEAALWVVQMVEWLVCKMGMQQGMWWGDRMELKLVCELVGLREQMMVHLSVDWTGNQREM